jgi:manganese-dependent inorganic pyrophosphatase
LIEFYIYIGYYLNKRRGETMEKVLVCGHRNPDMDSICSAYGYAALMNQVVKNQEFEPVRCGKLNESTKAVFEGLNLTPPRLVKDVRPRVSSIVVKPQINIDCNEPIHKLISIFQENDVSVVPVTKNGKYFGLLSIDQINKYFLKEVSSERPSYKINLETMDSVLKGKFIKRGTKKRVELKVMVGAMSFTKFREQFDQVENKDLPLLVVGDRIEPLLEAVYRQFPVIILTKISEKIERLVDFSKFNGTVFLSETHTSETLRLLRLCIPVEEVLEHNPPSVDYGCLFDEAKNILTNSHFRGLPVFDKEELMGFVTRRCFLEKPKTKIVMVDHNEEEQAVPGIEEAEVIGIIDHHRFGAAKTNNPIFITSAPLGSTCTIVSQLYERYGIIPDHNVARILLTGLISDTVILRSPTTTKEDIKIAEKLCKYGEIDNLQQYGQKMFESGISIAKQDPKKAIQSDFKIYKEKGLRVGIGQYEVTTLSNLDYYKDNYLVALEAVKDALQLDWALFMITDVLKENSVLLTTGLENIEYKFLYEKISDRVFSMPKVLSRKKQLLPEVIRVLEE